MSDLDFDDDGLNVGDPADRRGIKSRYITLAQRQALRQFIPKADSSALEIGCGAGRLSSFIARRGYELVAIDPSFRLLQAARSRKKNISHWCQTALPSLPFRNGQFPLVLMINVLRPLLLMGRLKFASEAARVVDTGGKLLILENIRPDNKNYVCQHWLNSTFSELDLQLTKTYAFRMGRFPGILPIRQGWVPANKLRKWARFEAHVVSNLERLPGWTYTNVIFEFQRS